MNKRYGLVFEKKEEAISRQIINAFFNAVNVPNLCLRKKLKFIILRYAALFNCKIRDDSFPTLWGQVESHSTEVKKLKISGFNFRSFLIEIHDSEETAVL